MKKNFSFLFALFLMFTGAMNVYANAYPFKITTDVENPELYAIQSGRGATYWWTLDEADGTIVLKAYESAPTQYWYFTEVADGERTFLQLHPYAAEGKAMGYKDTNAGAAKVWAVTPGEDGYDCRWIFDNNGGKAPYGLKTSNGSIYLSHYGGGSNKMGFWTTGPANDGGTAMYFTYVKLQSVYNKAYAVANSDVYELQQKYGLAKDVAQFSSNAVEPKEGALANLLDNNYETFFHSSWSQAVHEKHYLQVEVSEPVESFAFYFKKRHNNNANRPVDMTIMGSVDGVTYKDIANVNSGFPTLEAELAYLSDVITASQPYKYFRFVINTTNNNGLNNGYPFFTYSEFYILPNNEEVAEKVALHKAARNVLAINEFGEHSDVLFNAYLTLTDMLEKGAGTFAADLVDAYNVLATDYLAGKDITASKAAYDEVIAFAESNELFTAVVDEASLAANKRYLVVAEGEEGIVALSAQHNGATPYRLQAGIAEMAGVVKTECAANVEEGLPYMIALESAGEGVWKLKDVVNNAYLHWTEKRSIELDEVGSTWKISIKENGEAVIKLVGKDRTLRYGDEDDRFACYTMGQNAIKLYEDATANEFFVAYAQFGAVAETCTSLFMINAVSEKFLAVAETVEAMYPNVLSLPEDELASAVAAMTEVAAYAWEMDAKYQEFVVALQNCFNYLDNSAAPGKVAAAYAAVVDKYIAYRWSMPATTVADIDAYIAEMEEASYVYALAATPNGDFQFDNIVNVESEWTGAALGKTLSGHLYNTAAKAFLGTANQYGTQASFVENGLQWTVSTEALCDFEWLFDRAEDVCAANVGGVSLVPHKWVGDKTAPVPFAEGEDNGIVQTTDGIILPKTTSLFLDLNEESDLANYTLVYDMKLADVVNFTSLYQTTLDNNDPDGEIFIAKNQIGINHNGVGYAGTIEADTWHKIAVVGNGGFVSVYVDGIRVAASTKADNRWIIKKDGLFFFLDDNGETTDVELAGIQLWKKSLSDIEIAQLSGLTSLEIKAEALPARTAKWTFDNADDLFASEVGNITLSPRKVGANNTVPTEFAADEATGAEKTENGVALPKTTCLFMDLDEAADLTDYTFVYDLKVADSNPYISMYQTDLNNNNDGDLFINGGKFGINTSGLLYNGKVESNKWHRLAFVSKGSVLSIYIDGVYLKSASSANAAWTINKDGVFLFLDESGEHTAVEVGGIQFWNKALTSANIEAMGAAFDEDATTKVVEVPAAAAPTYTISGPLVHPSDANRHYLNNGYADGAAQDHVFTLVGKNLYTIQNNAGKYFAFKEGTTVVQKVDKMDENCYWQFVTDEEFISKFAGASYSAPANATFAIPAANFCYNDTEVKEWIGEPEVGGEYYNYVAKKWNVDAFDMSTVLRNMPNGVYRLKVQGFYRQGHPDSAAEARKNGTEIFPAKFYANGDSITVMSILDEAGNYTATTHGGMYGDFGKCPWSEKDASIYFNAGLYEHELVFTLDEGVDTIKIGMYKNGGVYDDWAVMDNYRLEYLGTTKEVSYFGEITQLTEGEKYVYYTDEAGKKHYLYAAGDANWVVVDEPTTIKFTQGNTTGFATAASFMESNGRYMSNAENGDGTGRINTQAVDGQYGAQLRTWESQVFYKNHANKYAIRLTNSTGTSWGCHCFVNINPVTLEISSGNPVLADELYLWEIEDVTTQDIQEVEVSEVANRAYYTLGGVPVDAPVKGVNIVKTTYTNGKVDIQKVYVK